MSDPIFPATRFRMAGATDVELDTLVGEFDRSDIAVRGSMSAYFESESLKGMARWMRLQADEERTHALKFYDFINQRNGRVTLTAIDAPAATTEAAA